MCSQARQLILPPYRCDPFPIALYFKNPAEKAATPIFSDKCSIHFRPFWFHLGLGDFDFARHWATLPICVTYFTSLGFVRFTVAPLPLTPIGHPNFRLISVLKVANTREITPICWGRLFHREEYWMMKNVFLSATLVVGINTKNPVHHKP